MLCWGNGNGVGFKIRKLFGCRSLIQNMVLSGHFKGVVLLQVGARTLVKWDLLMQTQVGGLMEMCARKLVMVFKLFFGMISG
ncbi:hypothetical protein Lalb_Chr25g0281261 [Lupinus albus]|uniref:Uncharacterized protein n=1 Tax=Lupinus albus TaxID=3870 RepID=A0A6A4N709_LUPAL|nr:hypothetical protein Lalb_Chr25g0281261 [Lupinus albus]